MKVVPYDRKHYDSDLTCLRCGVHNIPDNLVCGKCGANLPVVYDSEGNIRVVTDDAFRYSTIVGKKGASSAFGARGEGVRWMIRGGLILGALLGALWILRH